MVRYPDVLESVEVAAGDAFEQQPDVEGFQLYRVVVEILFEDHLRQVRDSNVLLPPRVTRRRVRTSMRVTSCLRSSTFLLQPTIPDIPNYLRRCATAGSDFSVFGTSSPLTPVCPRGVAHSGSSHHASPSGAPVPEPLRREKILGPPPPSCFAIARVMRSNMMAITTMPTPPTKLIPTSSWLKPVTAGSPGPPAPASPARATIESESMMTWLTPAIIVLSDSGSSTLKSVCQEVAPKA